MPVQAAEIETGNLSTLDHQRVIKKLIVKLDRLFEEGKFNFEVLPEADIDPGNSESKCPDIQFRDNENLSVPVIIEVATHFGWRSDFRKLRKLIDETEFGIQEGFVLDFQTREWHKYSKQGGGDLKRPFWSDVLKMDMRSLL